MSMSFLKLVINSFKEFFFLEMIVTFDNFNSIRPWITDLAAPPDPVSYTHLTLPTNREV